MASTRLLANPQQVGPSFTCLNSICKEGRASRNTVGKSELVSGAAVVSSSTLTPSRSCRFHVLPLAVEKGRGRSSGKSFVLQSDRCRLPRISCSGTMRLDCAPTNGENESSSWRGLVGRPRRLQSKRGHWTCAKASKDQWTLDQSPYETLGMQPSVCN